MADLSNRLSFEIEDISVKHGTTTPRLNIEVSAEPTNNNSVWIYRISPEIQFRFLESDKQLDGPIPSISNLSEITRSGTRFDVHVDLSRRDLDEIEKLREGGDLEIKLDIWVSGEWNDNREEARFDLSEGLIDAEWSRILDQFDYHDKRDVELNLATNDPRIRDRLATAHGAIEQAQRKHDFGDYPAAVTECRRAVETLRTIEGVEDIVHERKYEEMDRIMGNLEKGFTGGLAHSEEKTNITPAMRRDSEFALNITKACARYISTAIEESNP